MNRGDLAIAALPGSYGKPRPVLIIQSDLFRHLYSVTVLPLSSELLDAPDFRITIEPTPDNGLQLRSQVLVDKAHTLPIHKLGRTIGRLAPDDMATVNQALSAFLGFE